MKGNYIQSHVLGPLTGQPAWSHWLGYLDHSRQKLFQKQNKQANTDLFRFLLHLFIAVYCEELRFSLGEETVYKNHPPHMNVPPPTRASAKPGVCSLPLELGAFAVLAVSRLVFLDIPVQLKYKSLKCVLLLINLFYTLKVTSQEFKSK